MGIRPVESSAGFGSKWLYLESSGGGAEEEEATDEAVRERQEDEEVGSGGGTIGGRRSVVVATLMSLGSPEQEDEATAAVERRSIQALSEAMITQRNQMTKGVASKAERTGKYFWIFSTC